MELPKILVVTKEAAAKEHIKSLPVPLKEGEKVIVLSNQQDVREGYVRVKHGVTKKNISIFSKVHFALINGKLLVPPVVAKKAKKFAK